MMKTAITRSQLLDRGYTKKKIRDLVVSGELKESYGKVPSTGQIVRCYEWLKKGENEQR